MLYPFIYTRTKYHDYRVVTSKSLAGLPHSVVQLYTEVARTMIDAENSQLAEPSWALVKKNDYTLWGLAILNKALGEKCQDKAKRPVRGFFGFISDNQISRLSYSISYFKEIYNTYVMPIWDSFDQTEQINCQLPPISGDDFITNSLRPNNDINVELDICRVFPYGADCKGLIEACFASFEDCSIATNVHKKSRCIEFGKEKLSFMNVVGASDSSIRNKEDIKVYVKKEPHVIKDDLLRKDIGSIEGTTINEFSEPGTGYDVLSPEYKDKRHKKYLKYGLYGFITIICLILLVNGPSIWKAILSPGHTHEIVIPKDDAKSHRESHDYATKPFLTTNKSEISIQDATVEDVFRIQYQSSSIIIKVEASKTWIHVKTLPHQYAKSGVIEFTCEPLAHGSRDGAIGIVNKEGRKEIIPVYQTMSNNKVIGFNDGEKGATERKTPPVVQEVVSGDRITTESTSNTKENGNSDVVISIERSN